MAKPETAKELPFVRAEVGKISVGSGKRHCVRGSWRVRWIEGAKRVEDVQIQVTISQVDEKKAVNRKRKTVQPMP